MTCHDHFIGALCVHRQLRLINGAPSLEFESRAVVHIGISGNVVHGIAFEKIILAFVARATANRLKQGETPLTRTMSLRNVLLAIGNCHHDEMTRGYVQRPRCERCAANRSLFAESDQI